MTITIADGRGALWQWDTGRRLRVGSGVEQIHYQNKCFGRSVDVDVGTDGTAIIPDELLQDSHPLTAYAYVTDDTGAYTMVQQDFAVHKRAKPAGYVYTPTEQMTLRMIQRQIGDLADLTTEAKDTLVAAINEAARTGGAGSMDLRVADGYIQYSADGGSTWANLIAMAELKGADGAPGKDGHSPVVTATKSGKATTISVDGAAIATVEDGADGKPGAAGADGVTPHIGDNGNWYVGSTDTGKPSRGAPGASGHTPVKGTDYWTAADKQEIIDDIHPVFYIDLAGKYPNYTCQVAMDDIKAAYNSGYNLVCRCALGAYTATLPLFVPMPAANTWIFSGSGALAAMGFPAQSLTIAIVNGTVQASDTRLASMDDIPTIPTALKNPNELTIKIGSTTVTYDGSVAKTVEIADGSEVSY